MVFQKGQRAYNSIGLTKEYLTENYINQQKSSVQIARDFGCNKRTVLRNLKLFGIPTRSLKAAMNTSSCRAKMLVITTGRKCSDETKERLSESHKGLTYPNRKPRIKHDPPITKHCIICGGEFHVYPNRAQTAKCCSDKCRIKMLGTLPKRFGWHHSEETKKRWSLIRKGNKNMVGYKFPEKSRLKMSISHRGEKSWNWKGGISFEPYCPKFNRTLKEEIREKFDRKCFLCGIPENGRKHMVHHIDYNKMQGCGKRPWNLVPLCNSCHGRTNTNRWYWFAKLYNHWALVGEFFVFSP